MKKILICLTAMLVVAWVVPGGANAGVGVEAKCGVGNPQKRPAKMNFFCGDNGMYATSIRWRTWGQKRVKGFGTIWWNTCDPFCGAYNFRHGPGKLTLYRKVHCWGHLYEYSRLRVKAYGGPTVRVPLTTC